jgi:integrase
MPVNLTISNIDSKRMMITIERAKGKNDRLVPLLQMLLRGLREYYKEYKLSSITKARIKTAAKKKGFVVPAGLMMKPRLHGIFGSFSVVFMGFSAKRVGL